MIIECDTRQQKQKHIVDYFEEHGIKYIRNKLYCGDYKRTDSTKVIIDTKKDLVEVAGNLCRTSEHERIKREFEKAKEIGCERFVFLIADKEIQNVEDVENWDVPMRRNGSKYTMVKPETLKKIMKTIMERYNVEFIFCKKQEMGEMIAKLLEDI